MNSNLVRTNWKKIIIAQSEATSAYDSNRTDNQLVIRFVYVQLYCYQLLLSPNLKFFGQEVTWLEQLQLWLQQCLSHYCGGGGGGGGGGNCGSA